MIWSQLANTDISGWRNSSGRRRLEQSATRDSGLLFTFDIPEGDQVSPFSSVIRLTWRRLLWWSADVCIELCNSLNLNFCKVPPQLCDGNTLIHDICSSSSRVRLRATAGGDGFRVNGWREATSADDELSFTNIYNLLYDDNSACSIHHTTAERESQPLCLCAVRYIGKK